MQEYFVFPRADQPEFFPDFVRAKVFSGVEKGDALGELAGFRGIWGTTCVWLRPERHFAIISDRADREAHAYNSS